MKRKKEYIILAIVIAGLVLYLVGRSNNQGEIRLPSLQSVEKAKIDRMLIAKEGQKEIELTRKDDKWFIQPMGYPADGAKIRNMLQSTEDLVITALASESGKYEPYDLTPDKKVNVKVYAGGELKREFDIGKPAPTYQHTFIKLPGDSRVYHAKGTVRNTFDNSTDSLRDKTVLSFDKGSIRSLEIEKGGQTLSIHQTSITPQPSVAPAPPDSKEAPAEKVDQTEKAVQAPAQSPAQGKEEPTKTEWKSADGKTVDQAALDRLISSMASLQCDAYMEDAAKDKLTKEQWRLAFKNEKNEAFTIRLFSKEAEEAQQVPGLSSGSDYAFTLNQARVDTLNKQIEGLLNPGADAKP